MISYLDLYDADDNAVRLHGDEVRTSRAVTGLPGLPGLDGPNARGAISVRHGNHGAINRTRFLSDRILTIEGYVLGATRDAALAQRDIIMAAVVGALDTPRSLKWQRGDTGVELQTDVRYDEGGATFLPEGAERVLRYQIHFELPDPRAYAQDEIEVASFSTGGGGGGLVMPMTFPLLFGSSPTPSLITLSSDGIMPAPGVIRLTGSVSNPVLTQVETDKAIIFEGDIDDGDWVDIDLGTRQVTWNDATSAQHLISWEDTEWFELPPGGTIQLSSDSMNENAQITATYRPAYT